MNVSAWAFVHFAYAVAAVLHHDVQELLPMFGGVLFAGLVAAFFSREV